MGKQYVKAYLEHFQKSDPEEDQMIGILCTACKYNS